MIKNQNIAAVYSFWSKPFLETKDKGNGGFPDALSYYCSWTLSVLSTARWYDKVILVTDKFGAELLRDKLQLPFTEVIECLDEELEGFSSEMWAAGKIVAYRKMAEIGEAFIHFDSDVFIDLPIPVKSLLTQETEFGGNPYYSNTLELFFGGTGAKIPKEMADFYAQKLEKQVVYNMGIFGGTETKLILKYAKAALKLYKDNQEWLLNFRPEKRTWFNIIFEQYFFAAFCKKQKQEVLTLDSIAAIRADKSIIGYTHLLGFSKSKTEYVDLMKKKLEIKYPHNYKLCNNA